MPSDNLQIVPDNDEVEIDDDEPMDITENVLKKHDEKEINMVGSTDLFREKNCSLSGGSSTPSDSCSTPSSISTSSSSSPIPDHRRSAAPLVVDYIQPSRQSCQDLSTSFSWLPLLKHPNFTSAPVSTFPHVPLADCWQNIMVGMKVEAENTDVALFNTAYWVATVVKIQGYLALLRYEGFETDSSKDFWVNICSDKVHPVGWCATKGESLVPPRTIQDKYKDWKEFLVDRLTGARTFPTNFHTKIWEGVNSLVRPGMTVEVIDIQKVGQVKVAEVVTVTGRRLNLSYVGDSGGETEVWCHQESSLVKPVGWADRVGHNIEASKEYKERVVRGERRETDCTQDMFPKLSQQGGTFSVGMKLEVVDPVNLGNICVASVVKVLRLGYIMVRIDREETGPPGEDWFCYHSSSPLIFPPGFCLQNNLELKVPDSHAQEFAWKDYLEATRSPPAPLELFSHKDLNVEHGFEEGMKLECTDLIEPKLVCVATVVRVVGRLVKVHFDGWDGDYDQWMDAHSVNFYPLGWAELVGHRLEHPPQDEAKEEVKKEKKPVKNTKKKKAAKGNAGKTKKRRLTV